MAHEESLATGLRLTEMGKTLESWKIAVISGKGICTPEEKNE